MTRLAEYRTPDPGVWRKRLAVIVLLVVLIGLAVGWLSGGWLRASHGSREALFRGVCALFAAAAGIVQSTEILRVARDKHLWVPPVAMASVVSIACVTGASVPWLSFAAELLLGGVLITCAIRKRRLAFWCVLLCGCCAAGSKLAAVLPLLGSP